MNRTIRPRALSGKTTPELWPWEQPHRELAREAAGEGIVLLKRTARSPCSVPARPAPSRAAPAPAT